MTSKNHEAAFVWVWLPGETEPVVAGILEQSGDKLVFNYGQSYLARSMAIPLYEPELPLQSGELPLGDGLLMPNSIRDAAPDAWGRRVILNKSMGIKGKNADTADLSELEYLLESGSDRIGALDFQVSPTNYVPRSARNASLEELLESAEKVEKGIPLTPELDQALFHGSSIGGARPKALVESDRAKHIAKFSSSTDIFNVVKAEFVAMRLAGHAGIDAAPAQLVRAAGKDILLIERFDRILMSKGWTRKAMVSALTLFGLSDMTARYASYEELSDIIRRRFTKPKDTMAELFRRLVFNVLCGNTDDHARNHAAFWDGANLSLTPAYDICPQARTGNIASQAMNIMGNNNKSQLIVCLEAAQVFRLSEEEASDIIYSIEDSIRSHWKDVCDEAELSLVEERSLWERQFLNPYSFEGL